MKKLISITLLLLCFSVVNAFDFNSLNTNVDYDVSNNYCNGSAGSFSSTTYPCNVQDIDGKDIIQYINFTWNGDSSINTNWAFVYTGDLVSGKLYYYDNSTTNVLINESLIISNVSSYSVTTNAPTRGDLISPTYIYNVTLTNQYYDNSSVLVNESYIYGFDYVKQLSDDSFLIKWDKSVESVNGWVDITPSLTYLGKNLLGNGYSYYSINDVGFNPHQTIMTKWVYTANNSVKSGKWFKFGWLSSDNIINAINSGVYYFEDPWWSNNWAYRKKLTIPDSSITGNLINFTFMVNLTDIIPSGHAQSDYSDVRFTNEDSSTEYSWEKVLVGQSTYTNWGSGEPNDAGGEDCAVIRGDYYWNDLNCGNLKGYLCESNTHVLTFYSTGKTWSDAKADCESRGEHLATISSSAENTNGQDLAGSGVEAWIGYNDIDSEGSFVWDTPEGDGYVAYVRLPSILDGSDKIVYVYYGNPSATDGSSSDGTAWGLHVIGAYHFEGDFKDSSMAGNDLTNSGLTLSSNGIVGDGVKNNLGSNSYALNSDPYIYYSGDSSWHNGGHNAYQTNYSVCASTELDTHVTYSSNTYDSFVGYPYSLVYGYGYEPNYYDSVAMTNYHIYNFNNAGYNKYNYGGGDSYGVYTNFYLSHIVWASGNNAYYSSSGYNAHNQGNPTEVLELSVGGYPQYEGSGSDYYVDEVLFFAVLSGSTTPDATAMFGYGTKTASEYCGMFQSSLAGSFFTVGAEEVPTAPTGSDVSFSESSILPTDTITLSATCTAGTNDLTGCYFEGTQNGVSVNVGSQASPCDTLSGSSDTCSCSVSNSYDGNWVYRVACIDDYPQVGYGDYVYGNCTQEQANESTNGYCGYSNGSYSFSNAFNDGDWDTYELTSGGDFYVNYSIINDLSDASLKVKHGYYNVINSSLIIPDECLQGDVLSLKYQVSIPSDCQINIYCGNSFSYTVDSLTSDKYYYCYITGYTDKGDPIVSCSYMCGLYEESVIWNTTNDYVTRLSPSTGFYNQISSNQGVSLSSGGSAYLINELPVTLDNTLGSSLWSRLMTYYANTNADGVMVCDDSNMNSCTDFNEFNHGSGTFDVSNSVSDVDYFVSNYTNGLTASSCVPYQNTSFTSWVNGTTYYSCNSTVNASMIDSSTITCQLQDSCGGSDVIDCGNRDITFNLPTNYLRYWTLDEGSGTSACSSTSYFNDECVNLYNGVTWVTGKYGNTLSFDGVDDYTMGESITKNDLSALSFSVWVKPTHAGHIIENHVSNDYGSGNAGWFVRYNSAGTITYELWNGGSVIGAVTSTSTINDGEWHHLAGTFNYPGSVKIYIDGVLDASTTSTNNVGGSDSGFYIGKNDWSAPTNYYGGYIDDLKIYNAVLSQDDIINLFNNHASTTELFTWSNDNVIFTTPILSWVQNTDFNSSVNGLVYIKGKARVGTTDNSINWVNVAFNNDSAVYYCKDDSWSCSIDGTQYINVPLGSDYAIDDDYSVNGTKSGVINSMNAIHCIQDTNQTSYAGGVTHKLCKARVNETSGIDWVNVTYDDSNAVDLCPNDWSCSVDGLGVIPYVNGLSGFISKWSFDENTGSIAYDTNGLNDCEIAYPPLSGEWSNGYYGKSIRYDGNNFGRVNASSSLNDLAFTVCFWFKPETIRTQYLIDKNQSWSFMLTGNNNSQVQFTGYQYIGNIQTDVMNNSVWNHVCGSFDGGTAKIYLNGYLNSTTGYGVNYHNTNNQPLFFGGNPYDSTIPLLDGYLDDIIYYDYALSGDEVKSVYNRVSEDDDYYINASRNNVITRNQLTYYTNNSYYNSINQQYASSVVNGTNNDNINYDGVNVTINLLTNSACDYNSSELINLSAGEYYSYFITCHNDWVNEVNTSSLNNTHYQLNITYTNTTSEFNLTNINTGLITINDSINEYFTLTANGYDITPSVNCSIGFNVFSNGFKSCGVNYSSHNVPEAINVSIPNFTNGSNKLIINGVIGNDSFTVNHSPLNPTIYQEVTFIANYTDGLNNSISGATCVLNVFNNSYLMSYNTLGGSFNGTYTKGLLQSVEGTYTYNITCQKNGFPDVNASSNVAIITPVTVSGNGGGAIIYSTESGTFEVLYPAREVILTGGVGSISYPVRVSIRNLGDNQSFSFKFIPEDLRNHCWMMPYNNTTTYGTLEVADYEFVCRFPYDNETQMYNGYLNIYSSINVNDTAQVPIQIFTSSGFFYEIALWFKQLADGNILDGFILGKAFSIMGFEVKGWCVLLLILLIIILISYYNRKNKK